MKLNTKRTVLIGLAFMSISSFWQLYDQMIPLMLEGTFGLKATITGFIMSLDNILALFMLPLFGTLSDKVDTKLGKRTPFICVGTICAVVFLTLIPIANNMKNITFFIIALALTLIAMQSYRSPAVALMPDLTPKPLLSKANAIINLMGTVGGVITLVLIGVLVPEGVYDYFPLFVSIATIMLLCVVLLVLTVKEKKIAEEIKDIKEAEAVEAANEEQNQNKGKALPKDVKRSLMFLLYSIAFWFMGYNAVTTAFSRYAAAIWNKGAGGSATLLLIATVAATLAYIPIGHLSSKFGRRKMIKFGVALLATSFAIGFTIRELNIMSYIVFCLVGIAWASINVNSYPMVVSMASVGDTGKYTGIYYTFSMSAQIVTPVLSGIFIDLLGYLCLFPYAAICAICAFITFSQVKHGDIILKNEVVEVKE